MSLIKKLTGGQTRRKYLLLSQIKARFGPGPWKELGRGAEGRTFTDRRVVVKCLTQPARWQPRYRFLKTLPAKLFRSHKGFPTVLRVVRAGRVLMLISRYQAFSPVGVITQNEWDSFRRESVLVRLCFRDLHSRNFVRCNGRLRLVDVGTDLLRWRKDDFLAMTNPGFLAEGMTQSLSGTLIP